LVHLRAAQPHPDAGRDDGAGGGARRQPEDLVGRLAQVVLQDGQRTGDHHSSDAAAVNGDGDVFAKRFHACFLLSSPMCINMMRRES